MEWGGEGSREIGQKGGKDYILTSYVFMYDQGKLREATDKWPLPIDEYQNKHEEWYCWETTADNAHY